MNTTDANFSTDLQNFAQIVSITILSLCNIISFILGFCSKIVHSRCFKHNIEKIRGIDNEDTNLEIIVRK